MDQNNHVFRLLKIGAYFALLIISTWATVESAHKLLSGWPMAFLWILSAIFFSIASFGASLVIKSFNYSERVNGRGYFLLGGLVLLLLFWIGIILPTNTHTFYYKSIIEQASIKEIVETQGDLKDISARGEDVIRNEKGIFEQKVAAETNNYAHEILNIGRKGDGIRAEEILIRLEGLLQVHIQRLTLPGHKEKELREFIRQMTLLINEQRDVALKKYDQRLEMFRKSEDRKEMNALIVQLEEEDLNIRAGYEPTSKTKSALTKAFTLINRYSDLLSSHDKKEMIKTEPDISKVENVYYVWKDFFAGKLKFLASGFIYWIVVAVLIDIAGFIMFVWAFKPRKY